MERRWSRKAWDTGTSSLSVDVEMACTWVGTTANAYNNPDEE